MAYKLSASMHGYYATFQNYEKAIKYFGVYLWSCCHLHDVLCDWLGDGFKFSKRLPSAQQAATANIFAEVDVPVA